MEEWPAEIDIETTHYYVRFLPVDTVEVAILESDTILELWDHPLLFEIEQVGNWYHDPSIPDSLPTWQYTVVEKTIKNFLNDSMRFWPIFSWWKRIQRTHQAEG